MDTRSKIVGLDAAISQAVRHRAAIVTGYFDPLTAEHVRRLREIRADGHAGLIAVITGPSDPILPVRARAELAAALDMVDAVAIAPGFNPQCCPGIPIYREEDSDMLRFERLVDHVQHRHKVSPVR